MKLSVVIPVYNEQDNVEPMYRAICALMEKNDVSFELVLVNDGSKDRSWDVIARLAAADARVVGVKFSRNFGKEAAIFAGLRQSAGESVVVLDCDFQHPPETIIEMVRMWEQGDVDVVEAHKSDRGRESRLYRMFAKLFYKLLQSGGGVRSTTDFKLMDRKVVDALLELPERYTFFRAMSAWVGFRTERIEFDVAPRANGDTKWSLRGLIGYAINSLSSFSSAPLQIITISGIVFLIFAFVMAIETLYMLAAGRAAVGFTTVILLILITGGIIMVSLGIIGHYIAKIYVEVKARPRYIISEVAKRENGVEGSDS